MEGNLFKEGAFYILKITKNEMEYLVDNGVRFGEGGISHTVARGRRTYYLCTSRKNFWLHKKYENMIKIDGRNKKDKKNG